MVLTHSSLLELTFQMQDFIGLSDYIPAAYQWLVRGSLVNVGKKIHFLRLTEVSGITQCRQHLSVDLGERW